MKPIKISLLIAFIPGLVQAVNWSDGPLMVRSQAPVKSLVLSPMFRPAYYQPGGPQVDAAFYAASIYAIDTDYVMDYYTIEYRLGMLWSPSQRWQFGWSIASRTTNDAHLDQLTLSFHKLFGIDQNGRDQVPKHRSYLSIPKADFEVADFSGESIGRQYELSIGRSLYNRHRHNLSTTVVLAYEDDDNPRSGGGWDGSVQLDYQYAWGDSVAYLMGAMAYTDGDTLFGFELETSSWHWGLGFRHQLAPRHQLLLEYNAADGILHNLGQFKSSVHEINAGYRYHYRQLALEGVIIENFKYPDNSADVALVAKLRYQF
ncbi:DUF3187 family protein [Ferrimonas kyonanensis]|uniref:DUF3187 family protein n=1 Tax=Ferrimonas kyonanensis TaxID=364763 RepID=UPI000488DBB7|nr:DUF3187 family protein [Ferrimonas kyonanensis]